MATRLKWLAEVKQTIDRFNDENIAEHYGVAPMLKLIWRRGFGISALRF